MSQETLLILAGVVVPLVVQAIKAVYQSITGNDMASGWALNITYACCIILAAAVKLLSGEVLIPAGDAPEVVASVLTQIGVVIGLATVVYKALMSKSTGVLSK